MAVEYFRDDEDGYAAWHAGHPRGYIVNVDLGDRTNSRLHKSACFTLSETSNPGENWTESFTKACSASPGELDAWYRERYGLGLRELRCQHCEPSSLGLTP
jgi:hypothetical protein